METKRPKRPKLYNTRPKRRTPGGLTTAPVTDLVAAAVRARLARAIPPRMLDCLIRLEALAPGALDRFAKLWASNMDDACNALELLWSLVEAGQATLEDITSAAGEFRRRATGGDA